MCTIYSKAMENQIRIMGLESEIHEKAKLFFRDNVNKYLLSIYLHGLELEIERLRNQKIS